MVKVDRCNIHDLWMGEKKGSNESDPPPSSSSFFCITRRAEALLKATTLPRPQLQL